MCLREVRARAASVVRVWERCAEFCTAVLEVFAECAEGPTGVARVSESCLRMLWTARRARLISVRIPSESPPTILC